MIKRAVILILFLNGYFLLYGQVASDSVKEKLVDKIQKSKASQALMGVIKTNPETVTTTKSEDAFMKYNGKIIRYININHIGFDKTMYDTARNVKNTIIRIGNALHSTTKPWVIRNNLFIREGKPLNPYKVADNERYLRDLNFMLDIKIVVKKVSKDSVDLTVITRDIFSLGGTFSPYTATHYYFNIYDTNLAGFGQRLQFNGLIYDERKPVFGPEFIYSLYSVAGSLVNLSAGYTTLNTGSSYGDEDEYAYFLKLNRPLVSPYSRLAGGIEMSVNKSRNIWAKSDSIFRAYRYVVNDFWIGYNFGINNQVKNRNRHFLSLRAFNQTFLNRPIQRVENLNPIYNSQTYYLAQLTFFNQNFYKTRYIYGFGRTEDVPYGNNLSILLGLSSQLNVHRTSLGVDLDRTIVKERGDFYQLSFRAEAFNNKKRLEDVTLLLSASVNSQLYEFKHFKIRQNLGGSYTAIIKPTFNQLLRIDNDFGINGITVDSLRGTQRFAIRTETVMFTDWNFIGFRFAPIAFASLAFLSKEKQHIFYNEPYYGLGGGMRMRNENLVFGTIEFRGTYYPRVSDATHFKFSVTTNLRIKYTGSLIKVPSFIQYN